MSFMKKIKDILFEEEEYTEAIKIPAEETEEEKKVEEKEEVVEKVSPKEELDEVKSERELFKSSSSFNFPDFDEEEFATTVTKAKPSSNVLEYERKKTIEKRTDYGRYERVETKEYSEKRKFKPSPIISPVYGILNQDYKAEDIVDKKEEASNITIEEVRKKAFEMKDDVKEEISDEPVVTFFEEKETVKIKEKDDKKDIKSIDDLLEEASEEIDVEETLEIPVQNDNDIIEEELDKIEVEATKSDEEIENDLFELIDSMYDEREEDN